VLGEIVDGETIPGADELQSAKKLFRYFSDPPAEEMIHLVVQVPPSGEHISCTPSCQHD